MDASNESSSFNFQRIIIIIAIIMLIASMIFIGYALYDQSSNISWPPEIPKCPDFWNVDTTAFLLERVACRHALPANPIANKQ